MPASRLVDLRGATGLDVSGQRVADPLRQPGGLRAVEIASLVRLRCHRLDRRTA